MKTPFKNFFRDRLKIFIFGILLSFGVLVVFAVNDALWGKYWDSDKEKTFDIKTTLLGEL